jgi:hypothetical protein
VDFFTYRGVIDMKSAIAFAAILGLLWPTVAFADPPDCSRLLRQIYHHVDMVARANQVGRTDWAKLTQQHVERLEGRLANRCPRYSARDEQQEIARNFSTLMKVAATTALEILTLGAY